MASFSRFEDADIYEQTFTTVQTNLVSQTQKELYDSTRNFQTRERSAKWERIDYEAEFHTKEAQMEMMKKKELSESTKHVCARQKSEKWESLDYEAGFNAKQAEIEEGKKREMSDSTKYVGARGISAQWESVNYEREFQAKERELEDRNKKELEQLKSSVGTGTLATKFLEFAEQEGKRADAVPNLKIIKAKKDQDEAAAVATATAANAQSKNTRQGAAKKAAEEQTEAVHADIVKEIEKEKVEQKYTKKNEEETKAEQTATKSSPMVPIAKYGSESECEEEEFLDEEYGMEEHKQDVAAYCIPRPLSPVSPDPTKPADISIATPFPQAPKSPAIASALVALNSREDEDEYFASYKHRSKSTRIIPVDTMASKTNPWKTLRWASRTVMLPLRGSRPNKLMDFNSLGLRASAAGKVITLAYRTAGGKLITAWFRGVHQAEIVDLCLGQDSKPSDALHVLAASSKDGVAALYFFTLLREPIQKEVKSIELVKSSTYESPELTYYTGVKVYGNPQRGSLALVPAKGAGIRIVKFTTDPKFMVPQQRAREEAEKKRVADDYAARRAAFLAMLIPPEPHPVVVPAKYQDDKNDGKDAVRGSQENVDQNEGNAAGQGIPVEPLAGGITDQGNPPQLGDGDSAVGYIPADVYEEKAVVVEPADIAAIEQAITEVVATDVSLSKMDDFSGQPDFALETKSTLLGDELRVQNRSENAPFVPPPSCQAIPLFDPRFDDDFDEHTESNYDVSLLSNSR